MIALLQNKLLTFLLAAALVMGIAVEGVQLWKTYQEGLFAKANADFGEKSRAAEADLAQQKAAVELQVATYAAQLKKSRSPENGS